MSAQDVPEQDVPEQDLRNAFDELKRDPQIQLELSSGHHEIKYLNAIFQDLRHWRDYSKWRYVVTSRQRHRSLELENDQIVIYTGNEDLFLPRGKYRLLFCFYALQDVPQERCRVLPLGGQQLSPAENLAWEERSLDLFFAGQYLPLREDFARALAGLGPWAEQQGWRHTLLWTEGFRQGLSPADYLSHLSSARFALVPYGNAPLTFRLFEALQAGCIPVTPVLPELWFLKELPHIAVPQNWANLAQHLLYALESPREALHLHQKVLQHYAKYCSPASVAQYIMAEIQKTT